jgi:hypothetical protein
MIKIANAFRAGFACVLFVVLASGCRTPHHAASGPRGALAGNSHHPSRASHGSQADTNHAMAFAQTKGVAGSSGEVTPASFEMPESGQYSNAQMQSLSRPFASRHSASRAGCSPKG